jgi:hypothetical protein
VYAGELTITVEGVEHLVSGHLELRVQPETALTVHVTGQDPWPWENLDGALGPHPPTVRLPPGNPLEPPSLGQKPHPSPGATWSETFRTNMIVAGDLAEATKLVLHVCGELTNHPLPLIDVPNGRQGQLSLSLPGWELRLAAAEPHTANGFRFVVEATPTSATMADEDAFRLQRQVFVLLSLVTEREIGVGPVVGLDLDDRVKWAAWGAPRFRTGRPGVRWCPEHLVADALPVLVNSYATITADPAFELVLDRAVNHLLVANGSEPLDIRIPVACSGLELLGWAVLQREQSVDPRELHNAGIVAQRLLQWAGIPVEPQRFPALAARRDRLKKTHWAAADIIFNVRNKLVHPPRRLDEPEWPTHDELLEAWQVVTWYLELAILRVLGYEGEYSSRLSLGRSVWETEPVPWSRSGLPRS